MDVREKLVELLRNAKAAMSFSPATVFKIGLGVCTE